MNGSLLRLYTYENRRHHGQAVHEWLLHVARGLGIPGGSAYRAISSYGRGGRLHDQSFLELAGEQSVLIEFIADDAGIDALLDRLRGEGLSLAWARLPVAFGILEGKDAG